MEKIKIETCKGHFINATLYSSKYTSAKTILIAPATGVLQTYYNSFAEFLNSNDFNVITFDYKGIGDSTSIDIKSETISMSDWGVNDLNSIIDYIKEVYCNSKLIIIGHSIGGQLLGLCPSIKKVDLIITVAAQSGYWKLWSGLNRYKMLFYWQLFFPVLIKIYKYLPSKKFSSMENLPQGVAMEWIKWCSHPDYLFAYKKKEELFFNKIKIKIISYSSFHDIYAPQKAVDWMSAKYSNAVMQRKHLSSAELNNKVGHFSFFKPSQLNFFWKYILSDLNSF